MSKPNPLQLPPGAKEGCILAITWGEDERVEPGKFEGRLLKVTGSKIIVKFFYGPGYEISEEQISIDLESGLDLKYHGPVIGIELITHRDQSNSNSN